MFQYSYEKSTLKESGEHNTMNKDVALGIRIVNFLEKIRDQFDLYQGYLVQFRVKSMAKLTSS